MGYKSVDDKEWVCKACVGALLSWKIPAYSVVNGFKEVGSCYQTY